MSGKKGCSGGPRPGSGRPKTPEVTSEHPSLKTDDPIAWLTAFMQDETIDLKERKDAAKALLSVKAKKAKEAGKKGERVGAAGDVVERGRFAPTPPPPTLRAVK